MFEARRKLLQIQMPSWHPPCALERRWSLENWQLLTSQMLKPNQFASQPSLFLLFELIRGTTDHGSTVRFACIERTRSK